MTQAGFSHPNSLRIYGPPGSGKTRELVRILADHVAEGDFDLQDGIIVSFTRAAAHDIARRVNIDRSPGRYHCTLHALVKRYYGFDGTPADLRLRDFFREQHIPYEPARSPDPEEWQSVADAPKSEGALLYSFWSWCRNRRLSLTEGKRLVTPEPEVAHWWVGDRMEKLWLEYVRWKEEAGLADFTDWLEYSIQHPPGASWAFFAMDEAQDSTPLQWGVAAVFAACCEVAYLAGDDDQAIYAWAGATPGEFLGARVLAQDVLHVNHRSGSAIVAEAQALIRRNQGRQDKAMIATREGGEIGSSPFVPILNPAESTFVIARAHYLNEPVMAELERLEYPFVDRRGSAGVTGRASTAYERFLRLHRGQALTLEEWRLLLEAIPSRGPWLVHGAKKRVADLDKDFRRETYTRARARGRESDLLLYGATEVLVNAIVAGDTEPLARIDQARLGYLRGVERRYGAEYLDERRAAEVCTVGSIHSVKGLECDHVVLHGGLPPAATREALRDAEPERRVIYVGITRARERVTYYEGPAMAYWKAVI